jgi:hypothetical protein
MLKREHANESKGTWAEVFDKTNRVSIARMLELREKR